MIAFLKSLWRDRRGNALVIAAAALPLVLGSAGLASDTIEWALWKRQLQRAADSAAMAGVYAKVQNADYVAAVNSDLVHNNHTRITTAVTPNSPPPSGAYSSDPMAVRVSLAVQKELSFSSLFMSAAPTITATAIATIVPSGQYCVVSLEDTPITGINATGSTYLNLGCGMITNSTSLNAAVATGSSTVIASPIAAVGGIPASNNWGAGTTLQPFTVAQADPFAAVNPPAVPSGCNQNKNVPNNSSETIAGGCFRSLSIAGTAILSGEIILNGGGFTVGTQANVTCNGCTIILTNSDTSPTATIGNFEIVGSPEMHWTAPTSGTFKGLLVYQDRRAIDGSTNNLQNKLRGSSTSYFEGAFYFPKQEVEFTGTTGMNTNCLQMVGRRVKFSGNSSITNSCPAGSGAQSFEGKRVRLVA
jgi:Flp pilus assembly protein TadG